MQQQMMHQMGGMGGHVDMQQQMMHQTGFSGGAQHMGAMGGGMGGYGQMMPQQMGGMYGTQQAYPAHGGQANAWAALGRAKQPGPYGGGAPTAKAAGLMAGAAGGPKGGLRQHPFGGAAVAGVSSSMLLLGRCAFQGSW